MKKVLALLLALLTLFSVCLLSVSCNEQDDETSPDAQITVTFTVTSKNGTLNESKTVSAKETDSAWELFKANFTVSYEDGAYGAYIKTIDGVTADYNLTGTYFALYLNGSYATTGIEGVKLADGMTISFIEE